MANALATSVEEALRPVIGTVLASVSVDVETRRLGKTPDTVDRGDLHAIADNLVTALHLVVGRDMAEAAGQRVRALT